MIFFPHPFTQSILIPQYLFLYPRSRGTFIPYSLWKFCSFQNRIEEKREKQAYKWLWKFKKNLGEWLPLKIVRIWCKDSFYHPSCQTTHQETCMCSSSLLATPWVLPASALPTWLSSLSTLGMGVASRYRETVKSDLEVGASCFLSIPNQGPLLGLPKSPLLEPE